MKNEEMILKAKEAKSVDELLTLAKKNGIELSEADAKIYFEANAAGEISDDALGQISGGAAYTAFGGYLIVTNFHVCDKWRCEKCGEGYDYKRQDGIAVHRCSPNGGYDYDYGTGLSCTNCKYMAYRFPFQICTNSENRK